MTDLAARALGAGVVWANDESFAEREALVRPGRPAFDPTTYGPKGKVYDGWETRRRREPGHDSAIVRLGAPGVVRRVVVDTAHFTGNYPPEVSVEAVALDGHPSPHELHEAPWEPLVPRSPVRGDAENEFTVAAGRRATHVRLSIYPDGGVARLRVHGDVVADPRLVEACGTVDLAALELGGRVLGASDRFYSDPEALLLPGVPRTMAEGWETARRRDSGNDWVDLALAAPGVVAVAELDTTCYVHNAPGWAALTTAEGHPVLARTRLQPDTRHRFPVHPVAADRVRLDVFPDGGMGRVRLWGRPTAEGMAALWQRWEETG